jgi:hypothetical protein
MPFAPPCYYESPQGNALLLAENPVDYARLSPEKEFAQSREM